MACGTTTTPKSILASLTIGPLRAIIGDRSYLVLFPVRKRDMRLLLIGGHGFIGRFVAPALQRQGHELAVFHRGTSPAPAGTEEIRGDRNELSVCADKLSAMVSLVNIREHVMVSNVVLATVGQNRCLIESALRICFLEQASSRFLGDPIQL